MQERIVSHYRVLEKLGSGGMGVVYKAEDTRLGRLVALKFLPENLTVDEIALERFQREARAASALNHPNICTIYDIGQDEGQPFIVMELLEGRSLDQAIKAGPLSVQRALELGLQIADALDAAHTKGVIHRDIKPANIFITERGQAKVLDFGLAKLTADRRRRTAIALTAAPTAPPEELLTSPGMALGTVAYMSPEQARGEELDGRTDVFSLGVTLYEVLTGVFPFSGRTIFETVDSILHKTPDPPSRYAQQADPEIDRIVMKMLAKERQARYSSMGEVLAELRALDQAVRGSASGFTAEAQRAQRKGRNFWVLLVLVIAVFLAGGTLVWKFQSSREAVPVDQVKTISLAVLPFQIVRQDSRIDFLGFALADALISKFSYLQTVNVRPSSYIQKYSAPDPKTAGAELGVDHLLTGSLLAEGEWLRISVQFVDLKKDAVVWQDRFDQRLDNLLALQDEVVNRIVNGMNVQLTGAEASRLQRDISHDAEAFKLFLQAKAEPDTREGNRRARELLRRSLARDASFSRGWAELGYRLYLAAQYYGGTERDYEEAEQYARKAVEINPDSPEGLGGLTLFLTERGLHEEAYQKIKKWLEVSPLSAEAHFRLSYLYRYTGMFEESAAEAEQAIVLAPGNPTFRSAGFVYRDLGNFERAQFFFMLDGKSTWALGQLAELELDKGNREAARQLAQKAVATDPDSPLTPMRVFLLMLDGKREQASRILQERSVRRLSPDPEVIHYQGARLAWVGAHDKAIELLAKAVEKGYYPYPRFLSDPRLKPLHSDPRFQAVLEKAKQRHEAFKAFVKNKG